MSKRTQTMQPLDVLKHPDALLTGATVEALTGLKRSARHERVKAGTFPAPIRLSARCSRYKAGEIMAWLSAQSR